MDVYIDECAFMLFFLLLVFNLTTKKKQTENHEDRYYTHTLTKQNENNEKI